MAMIETARPAPFGAITSFRIVEIFSGLAERIREYFEAQRAAEQLSRLSPALLADIGLTEADVIAYRYGSRDF